MDCVAPTLVDKLLEPFCGDIDIAQGSPSDLSAIIGPVQEGLPLALAAGLITGFAVAFDLGHMAAHSVPAFDLSRILFWHSPPQVVAAIPLEPSARIVGREIPGHFPLLCRSPKRQRRFASDPSRSGQESLSGGFQGFTFLWVSIAHRGRATE